MYNWFLGLIAITSLINTATASIRCNRYDTCIDYTVPGSGVCGQDYATIINEVRGFTYEVACRRPCNEAEENKCHADLCKRDIDDCNKNPMDVTTCRTALHKCKGPIKMDQSICTDEAMERLVKSSTPTAKSSKTVMCSIDEARQLDMDAQGVHTVVIQIGRGLQLLGIAPMSDSKVVSCAGLSDGGAREFKAKTVSHELCAEYDGNHDEWSCSSNTKTLDEFKVACDQAQAAIGQKTEFKSEFDVNDEKKNHWY